MKIKIFVVALAALIAVAECQQYKPEPEPQPCPLIACEAPSRRPCETFTPKDSNGCDLCPVCVPCKSPACAPLPYPCKTFIPLDEFGCQQCPVCVPETPAPTPTASCTPKFRRVTLRQDFRRCVSPLCGGYFVRRVDGEKMCCVDGTIQDECYVARIWFAGIPKPANVYGPEFWGRIKDLEFPNFGNLGRLRITQQCGACSKSCEVSDPFCSYPDVKFDVCGCPKDCGIMACEGGPGGCETNDECNVGQYCRTVDAFFSDKECVDYAQEGESCGGFTLPQFQEVCAPGLECVNQNPLIADLPGKCENPANKCTKPNQVYKGCGSACPKTCDNFGQPILCTAQCVAGCFCEEGFVLDTFGNCIEEAECSNKCTKPNQVYKGCGSACPKTCDNFGKPILCTAQCVAGCFCEKGFVLDTFGNCIEEAECSSCQTNADCDNQFCRAVDETFTRRECVDFAQDGDSCGGFTLPQFQEVCAPGLICIDQDPLIADEPGICGDPGCQSEDDCFHDEFCRPTGGPNTPNECVKYSKVGDLCGGFVPPQFQSKCLPGLVCVDNSPPNLADAPGVCEQACKEDSDCDNQWCRAANPNAGNFRICVDFATEGKSCGGLTLPSFFERCAPGLGCIDQNPQIADEPGICEPVCTLDSDCDSGEWCRPRDGNQGGECVPFQKPGGACGGFTPIEFQQRCGPGFTCLNDVVADPTFDSQGVCVLDSCEQNSDCPDFAFCRGLPDSGKCASFVGEGAKCGGFFNIGNQNRCGEGLSCIDQTPLIADDEGICSPVCPKPNQEYQQCGSACPNTCESLLFEQRRFCTLQCVTGCQCKQGFALDREGNCVKQEFCPRIPIECTKWTDGCNVCPTLNGLITEPDCLSTNVCIAPGTPKCLETRTLIPTGCTLFNDGCNVCKVEYGRLTACTKRACLVQGPSFCVEYSTPPAGPFCGGIAGIQCPIGGMCVEVPDSGCSVQNGGADCGGVCVKPLPPVVCPVFRCAAPEGFPCKTFTPVDANGCQQCPVCQGPAKYACKAGKTKKGESCTCKDNCYRCMVKILEDGTVKKPCRTCTKEYVRQGSNCRKTCKKNFAPNDKRKCERIYVAPTPKY